MKSLYLATVSCVVFPIAATAMTCDVTPDCTALGFKIPAAEAGVTCKNKTRMKCPFGDFYFCSENICNGYLFNQTCESGDICGEACTDSNGTHYSGTSCSSAYKYEEVGIYHNIGANLANRDEYCSFLKGSRCFLNDFVASVVGTDCVPCSEKGYPIRYDLNKYEYIDSLDIRVCIDKTQSYWLESGDTRLVCKESAYPYTSSNCSGTLSGSTCSDSKGTHYKECQTCSFPLTSSSSCSSYDSCSKDGRTYYKCKSCKPVHKLDSTGKCIYQCGDYQFSGDRSNCTSYETCPQDNSQIKCTACADGYYLNSPNTGSSDTGTRRYSSCSRCDSNFNLSSPPSTTTASCKYYSMCGGAYRCDKDACNAAIGGYGRGAFSVYPPATSYEVGSGKQAFSDSGIFMCDIDI